MTAPEPRVQVTEYAVTCLPENHPDLSQFMLTVEWRGDDQWAVLWNRHALSRTHDVWSFEPSPSHRTDQWLADHRWGHDEALEQAKHWAPRINLMGFTAADWMAHTEARRA